MRQAVPKMIIEVGSSTSFASRTEGAKARWLDYELKPCVAPGVQALNLGVPVFAMEIARQNGSNQ